MADAELVVDCACELGEGALWHARDRCIYWTDIERGKLFRYDPICDMCLQVYDGDPVGGFTIQRDGALLLFMDRGTVKRWSEGHLTTVIEHIPAECDTRFNDVIADPRGRVFCGTMSSSEHPGRLYRLDPPARLTLLLEGLGCPNGLGFTPDRKHLYFTDSLPRKIYLFDYDEDDGAISNQRVFVDTSKDEGLPDGMTVDSLGNVWSAQWDGGCVIRYGPDGRKECYIPVPAKKPTTVTFGGESLTDLYITSAGASRRPTEGLGAGDLFRVRVDVPGVPEFLSAIG
jgi:D-xylonolactonase